MATSFSDLRLPQKLLDRIPFPIPTPIQADAIPRALNGYDVFATSQTGSGKTLAYVLPLISHVMSNAGASAMVLTPTRELAIQVRDELNKLIPWSKLRVALLIGGQSYFPQCQQISDGARIIVGTPGRIYDHMSNGNLSVESTQFVVLDEADRMLDMGFGPQVDAIMKPMPPNRQTLMFSATLSWQVEGIARKFLNNPARIFLAPRHQVPPEVEQNVIEVPRVEDKLAPLAQIIQNVPGNVLVFVNTKLGAEELAGTISNGDRPSHYLHGGLLQGRRDKIMAEFRRGQIPILVATDLLERGLDVPQIQQVVNFELPSDPNIYVHRVGRTSRAGAPGKATTIITPGDGARWRMICRFTGTNPPKTVQGGTFAP